MMKAIETLPIGYCEIYSVDLKKNKKLSLLVNILAAVISVLLIVPMCFFVPITLLFDMESGMGMYLLRFLALLVFMVLYIVLHELVHGVAMKICGTKKVKYGFSGLYAFAGSDDYYDKKAYFFIALAPVVLFGVIFALINPFVPRDWFWIVYLLQVSNLSGAAGDLYIISKFSRLPKDILINDCGIDMRVYSCTDHK